MNPHKRTTQYGTAKEVAAYKLPPALAINARRAAAFQPVFMTIANVGVRHAHSMGGEEWKDQ